LIPLGQIGVKILLAIEFGMAGYAAIESQSCHHTLLHHASIENRQRALKESKEQFDDRYIVSFNEIYDKRRKRSCAAHWVAQANRADVGVRLGTVFVLTIAEGLGCCTELHVTFNA